MPKLPSSREAVTATLVAMKAEIESLTCEISDLKGRRGELWMEQRTIDFSLDKLRDQLHETTGAVGVMERILKKASEPKK